MIVYTKVPHETFKAAAHLVVTGRKRKYSDVKIILAHLGGATPFLAPRVAVLSRHMGSQLTTEEMLEDFKSFYYDTALTAYDATLTALDKFVQPDHILFGTDFPGKSYSTLSSHTSLIVPLSAVNMEMAGWYTKNVDEHYAGDTKSEMVLRDNAVKLFPKLQNIMTAK